MKTRVASVPLADLLDQHTVVGAAELAWREGERLRCVACGHRCLIGDGLRGTCKVRYNEGGQLKVPYGYVSGLQCDPVEKKPFFHVLPGSDALTFGMMGCDFHCSYCQNWITSQALRDSSAVAPIRAVSPEQLVDAARREGARLVVSSYNEPLITAEWAVAVFRQAREAGIACGFVSNGNATPEVLDYLRPWIVTYKVDLKSFNDANYRSLGGKLDSVTNTIRMVHERGLWLEVVTLIIPGFNDSDDELRRAAAFLASVSPNIPWHVTAFHKDYRMTDPDATSPQKLMRAAEIGTEEGLRFVYAGNLPGRVGPWENTRCPSCRATVIERYGYLIRSYRVAPGGCCPDCGEPLPGLWPGAASEVRTGDTLAAYQSRLPRQVRGTGEMRAPLPLVEPSSSSPVGAQAMAAPTSRPPAALALSAEQKQKLVSAVAGMLRAVAAGQAAAFPAEPAELRDVVLAGAFISLKRGRHLRSCCGMMGQPVTLARALEHAADRTIWEDERFPPVSPTELGHLDMEVWLLSNPQRVAVPAAQRPAALTIGKHGIVISRGQSRGLFLPGVATENNWDAERFLDQVCVKAGLHPSSWRDDATELATFEGEVVKARVDEAHAAPPPARLAAPLRAEDIAQFIDICRANLVSMLQGMTPRSFWNLPDGQVNGVLLLVQRPGSAQAQSHLRVSLRPTIPLQATLYGLVQAAVQTLAQNRIAPVLVDQLQLGLAILHDPALHGTAADPHLAGYDPEQRALLVLERNKSALVFDPRRTAAQLLEEASRQARLNHPELAPLYSLDVVGNVAGINTSNVPHPVRGPATRPPAVAGTFYDSDGEALSRLVERLLEGPAARASWSAAMVPHAGLIYSGKLAADVLKRIQLPRTIIVLGPKHTTLGMDWAVAPQQTWAIPGAEIASDFMLARKLSQAIPGLELDAVAHQREHAIEVELPFLARLAPEARVVGIALGQTDLDGCRRFARGLAEVVRGCQEKPLLLISSDMNHFATDSETRRLDALALEALERGDPALVHETVTQHNISMCGVVPAVIVLETLRLLGESPRGQQVGYATSADATGDTSRVVGYAGMLFR